MSLTRPISFSKYITRIQGLFYSHLRDILLDQDISTLPLSDKTTVNLTVVFRDNSTLNGLETLVKKRDGVEIVRYGYEFSHPSGFFFHYEMEGEIESSDEEEDPEDDPFALIKKPCCHLHVGAKKEKADCLQGFPPALREHDGPHYGTHPVSLDFVLAVVVVNFFPNYEKLLHCLAPAEFLNRSI